MATSIPDITNERSPSDSDDSDQENLDDGGIAPDHYWGGDKKGVPFKDFHSFTKAIDKRGRASGIVKIIPPKEWFKTLPDIKPRLSQLRVKQAIIQDIQRGALLPAGAYRQINIECRKNFSVQSWINMAMEPERSPPVLNADGKFVPVIAANPPTTPTIPATTIELKPSPKKRRKVTEEDDTTANDRDDSVVDMDATPAENGAIGTTSTAASGASSPLPTTSSLNTDSLGADTGLNGINGHQSNGIESTTAAQSSPSRSQKSSTNDDPKAVDPAIPNTEFFAFETEGLKVHLCRVGEDVYFRLPEGITTQNLTQSQKTTLLKEIKLMEERSKTPINTSGTTDKPATKYKRKRLAIAAEDDSDLTINPFDLNTDPSIEYCQELERYYWKNLTYGSPLYGADMLGTLFDDKDAGGWNMSRLDNLLSDIRADLPGVNLPYLYFGMWKATFAWHLEDMDLFSINYIHFGAPKQWYVVPPRDRLRFERLAKQIFFEDSKACPEFLRHKTSLLSPVYLAKHNIHVNRMVQKAGEFIITFPYGYHAGYNLGINCAESVNFALESWIENGKAANHCQCIEDAVKMDVAGLFDPANALRDEVTSSASAPLRPVHVMKREIDPIKNLLRKKVAIAKETPVSAEPSLYPCELCASTNETDLLKIKGHGHIFAHRKCAEWVPQVSVKTTERGDLVCGFDHIEPDRWKLHCEFCKHKGIKKRHGAPIQCCKGKCSRAFHVTCAIENGLMMVERDGEADPHAYCKAHDPRVSHVKPARPKFFETETFEELQVGQTVYFKWNGGIHTGEVHSLLPMKQYDVKSGNSFHMSMPFYSLSATHPNESQEGAAQS
ncbi:hypothetical protein SmJEL517_g03750 [Synchytrium microbalum]|uniref:[histone H3]-trimethyl-L-lysine(9) demethylase n=1 Tax=Synchytrium microbalum TaxID=1806994 RepID=A0A507C1U5_9FUNG|nr:uncharacterized protein SmJEL517_g03750 [Synchytrium microbalum]TPX33338.1 hypothetical protein SmJEL517_g03750 [Synchytrium microbalum]